MYPKLIDISHWQGDMNWVKTASSDAKGVIIRAGSINYTTGVPYADYKLEQNAEGAEEHMDIMGFYWFWRANQDPIVQAQYFANLIRYKKQNLAPVADVEASNGIGPYLLADRLKKFLDEVERQLTVRPIIYTRASFWNVATTKPPWALNYDLWCARYHTALTSPWSDGRFKCYPWAANVDNWKLWQWSADGNGMGHTYGASSPDIDINYFNGTDEELRQWAGLTPIPVPDTVEIDREVALAMYNELKKVFGE
ncbi:MAG: glycoside hydrolase family 25 protein [Candidatus Thorarchaeota archaeon]|jgi:lysozyme